MESGERPGSLLSPFSSRKRPRQLAELQLPIATAPAAEACVLSPGCANLRGGLSGTLTKARLGKRNTKRGNSLQAKTLHFKGKHLCLGRDVSPSSTCCASPCPLQTSPLTLQFASLQNFQPNPQLCFSGKGETSAAAVIHSQTPADLIIDQEVWMRSAKLLHCYCKPAVLHQEPGLLLQGA